MASSRVSELQMTGRVRIRRKVFVSYRETDRQLKKAEKGGGKWSVALFRIVEQLGCVSQDAEPPKAKFVFKGGHQIHEDKDDVLDLRQNL